MNRIFFLISICAFLHCKATTQLPKVDSIYYYENFDLFFLKGLSKISNKKANNFVKVGYKKGEAVPLFMVFKRDGPIIKFVLRDSFRVEENKTVYEYYTKNFFGEAPGKHFDFGGTFGWSYNEYYVYVDISNTLFCKQIENYEVANASPIYRYFIDENGESFKCVGQYNVRDSQFSSKEEQYVKWVKYFVDKGQDACSKAELIPK